MSMLRMVAWGMVDMPQDEYSEEFNHIENEVWHELRDTALRIFCRKSSYPFYSQWTIRQQGSAFGSLRDGTFRECCQYAVEILDAAK